MLSGCQLLYRSVDFHVACARQLHVRGIRYTQLYGRICGVFYADENQKLLNIIYDITLHKFQHVLQGKLKALLCSRLRKEQFSYLITIRRCIT
jgi:hypothetical protein